MSGFRKILCPVDFSDTSREAMRQALAIARRFESEAIVLHVLGDVPLLSAYTGNPRLEDLKSSQQWAQHNLTEFVHGVGDSGTRVQIELIHSLEHGGTTERAIVHYAQQHGVDLLVMGKHGRKPLEDFFFGSVTDRVLRHARCPVLVVPPSAQL
jgi:nucleotide-binding universal stress UspA family protein